jgi:hypothetical protein
MIGRHFVVSLVAAVAAASMLPLDADAAGVELIERQTSGLAGAATDLWLLARSAGAGAPSAQAGEVVFGVDRRRLDASAIDGLVSAPVGTRLGFATTDPPGDQQHDALTKTGALVDPATGDPVVTGEIAVAPELVGAVGPSVPVTLRATSSQLLITIDLRRLAGALARPRFGLVSIYLFGHYGHGRTLARNPATATTLTSSLTVRPCADAACSQLGPSVEDALAVTLPMPLTVSAPRRVTYGVPARFRGSGSPGDRIELAYELEPGVSYHQQDGSSGEARTGGTAANFGRYPLLAPIYQRVLAESAQPRRAITTVEGDGRWSLAVALRTRFPSRSIPYPATGRYAAVAYRDPTGGRFSIIQAAAQRTIVSLAKPGIRLTRRARRLHVGVTVRGGDRQVTITLRERAHVLATQRLERDGRASITIEHARRSGPITATATADGARSARSSAERSSVAATTAGVRAVPPGGVYGGRSMQDHPMSLRLTRVGNRLRDVFFRVDADMCNTAPAAYSMALHLQSGPSVAVRADGGFADTRHANGMTEAGSETDFEVALRGTVGGSKATGTIRVSGTVSDPMGDVVDRCDSGTVRWTLHRGSAYGGATADERALSIRPDRDRKRLRSFFIDLRVVCDATAFLYSLEHLGVALRRDGSFSKHGLSGLPRLGPAGSSVSGQFWLRGRLGARRASGTYRAIGTARTTDGTTLSCDTGVVRWTARRA